MRYPIPSLAFVHDPDIRECRDHRRVVFGVASGRRVCKVEYPLLVGMKEHSTLETVEYEGNAMKQMIWFNNDTE